MKGKHMKSLACFISILSYIVAPSGYATVGFAEWEIDTPGGNKIGRLDSWKEKHGTCLLTAGDERGLRHGRDEEVYVSHIGWWQFFEGYIIGESKQAFFLFDEQLKVARFFKSEALLKRRVNELRIGRPISKKLTPSDGWTMVWGPVLKAQYEKLRKRGEYEKMSEDQKRFIDELVENYDKYERKTSNE
jgi:hypothetical protein